MNIHSAGMHVMLVQKYRLLVALFPAWLLLLLLAAATTRLMP